MAPALDPPVPAEVVKATSARPLTGLTPTACGAKNKEVPFESADGKLTKAVTLGAAAVRSTTASVGGLDALLATSARLRRLSVATLTGPDVAHDVSDGLRPAPTVPVQMKPTGAGG